MMELHLPEHARVQTKLRAKASCRVQSLRDASVAHFQQCSCSWSTLSYDTPALQYVGILVEEIKGLTCLCTRVEHVVDATKNTLTTNAHQLPNIGRT